MSKAPRVVVALVLVAVASCGAGSKKASGPKSASGNEDLNLPSVDDKLCDTKGKKVALYDLNQDGKPDVWKLSDDVGKGEFLTCKQVDLNHDGKIDFVTQYDEAGRVILEEYDFDFDGKFDARVHFDKKTGRRYAAERVSGFHDRFDVWEKYGTDDSMEAMRRDRNGDGKPDYWEQYLGGNLDKVLYDDDFDGKVDRKEEARPGRDIGTAAAATPTLTEPPADTAKPSEKPRPAATPAEPKTRPEPALAPGEKEEPPSADEEK